MASCFSKALSLKDNEISINHPFAGGYITQSYGEHRRPWIQVEMNRNLYLKIPYFERNTLFVDKKRIRDLNNLFEEVLSLFF
jgi:formiminoglutamase